MDFFDELENKHPLIFLGLIASGLGFFVIVIIGSLSKNLSPITLLMVDLVICYLIFIILVTIYFLKRKHDKRV